MVKDKLINRSVYGEFTDKLNIAFEFLEEGAPADAEYEMVEIKGEEIYALHKKYETQEQGGIAEAHKKYIDIHYCVSGSETICYSNADYVTQTGEYEENTDCVYFEGAKEKLILHTGEFAVFYPEDVHLTGRRAGTDTCIEKILVKVMV